MRRALIAGFVALLAACVTPGFPVDLDEYFGPLPPAPSADELAGADFTTRVWREHPMHADFAIAYPQIAERDKVEARVILDCIVQPNLRLACAASDDGWPEYDFELAARYLSTRIRA